MKHINRIVNRGLIGLLFYILALAACNNAPEGPRASDEPERDYDHEVDSVVNTLKSPVVLIGKDKTLGMWGVVLKDGTGFIYTIGDFSSFANKIGASRNIGDTIK